MIDSVSLLVVNGCPDSPGGVDSGRDVAGSVGIGDIGDGFGRVSQARSSSCLARTTWRVMKAICDGPRKRKFNRDLGGKKCSLNGDTLV